MNKITKKKIGIFTVGTALVCATIPFAINNADNSILQFLIKPSPTTTYSLTYNTLSDTASTGLGNVINFNHGGNVSQSSGEPIVFAQGGNGYIENVDPLNDVTSIDYDVAYGRATFEYGFLDSTDGEGNAANAKCLFFEEVTGSGTLTLDNHNLGQINYIKVSNREDWIDLKINSLTYNFSCGATETYNAPNLSATINGNSYNATTGADIENVGHLGLRYNTNLQKVVATLDLNNSLNSDLNVSASENSELVLNIAGSGTTFTNLVASGAGEVIIDSYLNNATDGRYVAYFRNDHNITSSANKLTLNAKVDMSSENLNSNSNAIVINGGLLTLNGALNVYKYGKAIDLESNSSSDALTNFVTSAGSSFVASKVLIGIFEGGNVNKGEVALNGDSIIEAKGENDSNSFEAITLNNLSLNINNGKHLWSAKASTVVAVDKMTVGSTDNVANVKIVNDLDNGDGITIRRTHAQNTIAIYLKHGTLNIIALGNQWEGRAISLECGFSNGTSAQTPTIRIGNTNGNKIGSRGFRKFLSVAAYGEPYYGEFSNANFNTSNTFAYWGGEYFDTADYCGNKLDVTMKYSQNDYDTEFPEVF